MTEAFASTLAAARLGEPWAWAQIYRDLAGPVTGYLATRGGAEPEDLASETFLHIARGIHAFEGDEAQFRSWVFVIAHRRVLDERRTRSRRPATVPFDLNVADVGERVHGGDVETEAMAALESERAREMLEDLTDAQRDVIMLRVVGGLSLQEAALVLGKPVGAIKALQHRAITALHEALSQPGADAADTRSGARSHGA